MLVWTEIIHPFSANRYMNCLSNNVSTFVESCARGCHKHYTSESNNINLFWFHLASPSLYISLLSFTIGCLVLNAVFQIQGVKLKPASVSTQSTGMLNLWDWKFWLLSIRWCSELGVCPKKSFHLATNLWGSTCPWSQLPTILYSGYIPAKFSYNIHLFVALFQELIKTHWAVDDLLCLLKGLD